MTVWSRHREFVAEHGPITVGIIGAGYVGAGLVHLLDRLDGFRPAVIVNRNVERAVGAYVASGHARDDVVVARTDRQVEAAYDAGRPTVTDDPHLAVSLDRLDVLVEATGALDYGATVMLDALIAGRSVVSINAEVDATIGWLLHQTASENGGVYTICDGDQPGVLMRTLDHVDHMGFTPLVAVNCKRHLDIRQNPTTSAPYAARDGTSPEVTTSAGDGTKMNIENAVVANLTGMPPDRRGMHGVPTTLEHAVRDVLDAVSRTGVVEYTLGGDFGAGVFVIGCPPDPQAVQRALRFFKMGDGPDYLFFRPYTMVHFEMPLSIAEVVLDRVPLWSPSKPPVSDVVAVAKRDLDGGEPLDGIGGHTCYGQIDTVEGGRDFLPIALAHHARMTRPVPVDEPVPLDAVELDPSGPIVELRRRQDELLAAAPASAR
jgi:predicted homoserine dehydrogenase-like protein